MNIDDLLPCAFCGAPAETDYNRSFYDYRGRPGNAIVPEVAAAFVRAYMALANK